MSKSNSTFTDDLKGEKVVGKFLDRYLYSKLAIDSFVRDTPDEKDYQTNQKSGIDVRFVFNGKEYIIDEKASLDYPLGLPTFAFELKYRKNDEWKKGWFFDDTKVTEYYLLAWPIREAAPIPQLQIQHIKKVEVILISRQKLQDYLFDSFNLDEEAVEKSVDAIIKKDEFRKLHYIHPDSQHYYYYTPATSSSKSETPINMIIRKEALKSLAEFQFITYRNKPYLKMGSVDWLKEESK